MISASASSAVGAARRGRRRGTPWRTRGRRLRSRRSTASSSPAPSFGVLLELGEHQPQRADAVLLARLHRGRQVLLHPVGQRHLPFKDTRCRGGARGPDVTAAQRTMCMPMRAGTSASVRATRLGVRPSCSAASLRDERARGSPPRRGRGTARAGPSAAGRRSAGPRRRRCARARARRARGPRGASARRRCRCSRTRRARGRRQRVDQRQVARRDVDRAAPRARRSARPVERREEADEVGAGVCADHVGVDLHPPARAARPRPSARRPSRTGSGRRGVVRR